MTWDTWVELLQILTAVVVGFVIGLFTGALKSYSDEQQGLIKWSTEIDAFIDLEAQRDGILRKILEERGSRTKTETWLLHTFRKFPDLAKEVEEAME